jgi:hypothetical protein
VDGAPADLGRSHPLLDESELAQGDEAASRVGDLEVSDLVERVPVLWLEPHLNEEPFLPFEHLAQRLSSRGLHRVQDLAGVDSIAGDLVAKNPDPEVGKPSRLLGLDVGRARDPGDDARDLLRLVTQHVQIAPVQSDRDVRADPREELLHPELDGLGVAEDVSGDRFLERALDLGDEVLAGRRGGPLLPGLEDRVDVAGLDAHGIGRDLGASRPGDDGLDFRKLPEDVLDEGGARHRLGEGHARKPPRLEREGALLQAGDELRAHEARDRGAYDEHRRGRSRQAPGPRHRPLQPGLVDRFQLPHEPGLLVPDLLKEVRPEHRHEREREDEGPEERKDDGEGHGTEHLPFDAL